MEVAPAQTATSSSSSTRGGASPSYPGFALLSLPYELKRRTASFLSSKDAVELTRTCRTLHSTLRLSCLEPSELFDVVGLHGDYRRGDEPQPGHYLPLVLPRRVHSVNLSLHWQDQGWGNRKGKVYVVGSPWPTASANESAAATTAPAPDSSTSAAAPPTHTATATATSAEAAPDLPWKGGRLVYESPLAEHTEQVLRVSFVSSEGERYRLWYKVGGGGGHFLHLSHARAWVVVFDEPDGSVGSTHRVLGRAGLLLPIRQPVVSPQPVASPALRAPKVEVPPFYLRLLMTVCRSLRLQRSGGEYGDALLLDLLAEHGISSTEGSLRAVEEFLHESLEERGRLEAEAAAAATQSAAASAAHPEEGRQERPRLLRVQVGGGGMAVRLEAGARMQMFDDRAGGWVDADANGGGAEIPDEIMAQMMEAFRMANVDAERVDANLAPPNRGADFAAWLAAHFDGGVAGVDGEDDDGEDDDGEDDDGEDDLPDDLPDLQRRDVVDYESEDESDDDMPDLQPRA